MGKNELIAAGRLLKDSNEIQISVIPASKYSLYVVLAEENSVQDDSSFDRLFVTLKDEDIDLGPCRYSSLTDAGHYNGYLTFVRDIYDVRQLFEKHKKSHLQRGFHNLSLILSHQDQVKQEFKDYTADLTYCLSVYRQLFNGMDDEYIDEPEQIRSQVQQTIIANEGADFIRYFEKRLKELEKLVSGYTLEEHERHGYYFRKQVWSFIRASAIMLRNNVKPRGYSGDFEIMRMIYTKDILGQSTFSKLMHKHPVEHPAAQAVRNRRILISRSLRDAVDQIELVADQRLKVLSVACGPAFELRDILKTAADCKNYDISLLDQDEDALQEAKDVVDEIQKQLGMEIMVSYLQESVRIMMSPRRLSSQWGKFHFIYSMGLFDYLTPPVAKAVITNLYRLLEPGGQLFIGNFHVSNPSRVYMEYWNDWVLYYRTEDDMLNLLQQPGAQLKLEFEETHSQMFLKAIKPAAA